MENWVITNLRVYKAIADESYQKMVQLMESGRRPKPDGSDGWIITYDPEQPSFKQSMISIAFTGMWLEALLHLLIVQRHGKDKFREYDFKSYEDKLALLGCEETVLVDRVSRFRRARKLLVHEKAHFDVGDILTAQDEAVNAHEMLTAIHNHFSM